MFLVAALLMLAACALAVEVEPDTSAPTAAVPASGEFEPRPHRAAPAPPSTIVADSSAYYAATDSPQLIEIFTDW